MDLLKKGFVLSFSGKKVEVGLITKDQFKIKCKMNKSLKVIKPEMSAYEIHIFEDREVIRNQLYYDKCFYFNSIEDYDTLFPINMSAALLYDDNLTFYYNCMVTSIEYLIYINDETLESLGPVNDGNYEIVKVGSAKGFFVKPARKPLADYYWYPDYSSVLYFQNLFSME